MAPKHRLYTPEIAETILERLSDGDRLRKICEDEGMPSRGAVQHWVVNDHEGFASRYARACEIGLQLMAEDTLDISDDGRNDVFTADDGDERTNHDVVARSKLRVDTRKWLLSKMLPKVYGDKLDLNHSGVMEIKAVPDDQLESRLANLLGKAGIAGAAGGASTAGPHNGGQE